MDQFVIADISSHTEKAEYNQSECLVLVLGWVGLDNKYAEELLFLWLFDTSFLLQFLH